MSKSHGNDGAEALPESLEDAYVDLADEKEKELGSIRPPASDESRPPSERAPDASTAHHGAGDDNDGEAKLPMSKARCIALVATVMGAAFLNTLSIQSTVIILPSIGRDLNIPESRVQWVVSANTLTFGCFLLFWGRIADIYGKKTIFILGSGWLVIAAAINPFLPNEIAFYIFRALQGLGSAANVPTAIGILGTTFPPGKAKNYAFSTYSAGAPLGSIFGNLLGGFISQYASWKWVFGAVAILGAIVTLAGIVFIPAPKHTLHDEGVTVKASVDWLGAALITVGSLTLMLALTEGNVVGWSTPWIPVLIVVSVILIVFFVLWQRHLEKRGGQPPLMKVSIFKSARFSAAMAIMALAFSSFNNFIVYATYYYQNYQGLDPLQTTLRFLPTGIGGVLIAAVVAQLLARIPTYFILAFGNASVTISNLLFAVPIPPATTYFAYGLPAMILSVVGADTAWPCLTLFTSHSLPQEDQALGGALVNMMGQIGRTIGLAIATAIQTAVMAKERGVGVEDVGHMVVGEDASLAGLRAANWWSAGLGLMSLVLVIGIFRGSGIIGKAGVKREAKKRAGIAARGALQEPA
ncbi:MFS general substrate transporter [Thozetella sp. PMI_491]|nr:MFS general substrate transporter [Thozetella sp. PMI_491]